MLMGFLVTFITPNFIFMTSELISLC